jgi:hypothetical protein
MWPRDSLFGACVKGIDAGTVGSDRDQSPICIHMGIRLWIANYKAKDMMSSNVQVEVKIV